MSELTIPEFVEIDLEDVTQRQLIEACGGLAITHGCRDCLDLTSFLDSKTLNAPQTRQAAYGHSNDIRSCQGQRQKNGETVCALGFAKATGSC